MEKKILVNSDSADWYERCIEEPVRDLVRLLRNNGINTECSCGHEMYIQCQFIPNKDDPETIITIVSNYLWEQQTNPYYDIEITIKVRDGHLSPTLLINLNPNIKVAEREEYFRLLKEKK